MWKNAVIIITNNLDDDVSIWHTEQLFRQISLTLKNKCKMAPKNNKIIILVFF